MESNIVQDSFFMAPVPGLYQHEFFYELLMQIVSEKHLLCRGIIEAVLVFMLGVMIFLWGKRGCKGAIERKPKQPFWLPLTFSITVFLILSQTVGIKAAHYLETGAYVIDYSSRSFFEILIIYCISLSHLPLYPFLLKSISPLSHNLDLVRLLSVFFFSVSVFYLFKLLHLLFEKKTATICTLIFCLSPFLLTYATFAQPYAFLLLFVTTYTYLFVINLKYPGASRIPIIITGIVGAYIHVLFWLVPLSSIIAVVLTHDRRSRHWREFALIAGCIIIFVSPLVVFEQIFSATYRSLLLPWIHLMKILPVENSPQYFLYLREIFGLAGTQITMLNRTSVVFAGALFMIIIFLGFLIAVLKKEQIAVWYMGVFLFLLFWTGSFLLKIKSCNAPMAEPNTWAVAWRYGILLVPFFYLACGSLINLGLAKHKYKTIYIATVFVVVFQCLSAYTVLFKEIFPDSKKAWEFIESNLKEGDGIIVTPAPIIFNSLYYYASAQFETHQYDRFFLDRLRDIPDYTAEKRMGFLNRVWNVCFDYRDYGLYPSFNDYGKKHFNAVFSDWKVTDERTFPFLRLTLLERLQWPKLDGDKLSITAGINDLLFIRNVRPSVFYNARARLITGQSQLIVPFSEKGEPRIITICNDSKKLDLELSGPSGGGPRLNRTNFGYIILLNSIEGFKYNKIEIDYSPPLTE